MTSDIINRQPKGIPVGGQFAAATHGEPAVALSQPAIEEMGFTRSGRRFDIERDGAGLYTVYEADGRGEEIASFTFTGNPADRDAIEAAATAAQVEQEERLGPVSTPGARVTWTDPDGGAQQSGKVIKANGEIIVIATEAGGEAEVFGNELAVDEDATRRHHLSLTGIDTDVIWTNPETGEKVRGRSLGEIGGDKFAFQVPAEGGFQVAKANELELAPPAPPGPPVKFIETQRKIRGHNFYAPKAILSKVPALGATEGTALEDKKVHLHYFTGGADWYIMEVDPSTGRAFGFLNPNGQGGHWGFVSLPDLEKFNAGGYRVV